MLKLLRESPYVGFCRHAPPSPNLNFARDKHIADDAHSIDFPLLPDGDYDAGPVAEVLPGHLPMDVWATILSHIVEVPLVPSLARLASGINEVLHHQGTWQGSVVHISPGMVPALAPVLSTWVDAWRGAAKLVVPRSSQLQAKLSSLAPELQVEVVWRFDARARGEGLQVVRAGEVVCRIDDDDVVVLGDAPLVVGEGRPPYIEVRLEAFAEGPSGDGMNEFGIGFTASNPEELSELGAVAAEVPDSWVVDFTENMVCLSINNCEEAKGYDACSNGLQEGDHVGLRVAPEDGAIEVFINGQRRDRLQPPPDRAVPVDARLFPVLDLFGRVTQITRCSAEAPRM